MPRLQELRFAAMPLWCHPYTETDKLAQVQQTRMGVALAEARRRKERRYPELLNGGAASLVVLAFETGGRWSRESWHFLRRLVKLRVRRAPHLLRRAAALGWHRRWTCLFSVAAQRALASTLLEPSATVPLGPWGVEEPELATVLQQAGPEPGASRLPLR